MLKWMRENLKSPVLWGVVLVFVALIFFDWGGGGRLGQSTGGMGNVAARIGKIEISEEEFIRHVRFSEQRYSQMYGKQWEMLKNQIDLGDMAIRNLIDRNLMLVQAEKMGVVVSDEELRNKIVEMPMFQGPNGGFVGSAEYLQRVRAYAEMSVDQFERALRQDLTVEKLRDALTAAIILSDVEVEREYRRQKETASFELLFVSVDRALAGVTVGDDEAKVFYEANKDRFKHPDQKQLRYLLVDNANLRNRLTVAETQITEYYNTHQQEFSAGEEVKARHILIKPKTTDEAGMQQAQTRARELWKRANAPGADFAALARQNSEDEGSKPNGGDVGWIGRGRMLPEFENAAFALKIGEVSGPTKSQFGYHIIKLDDRRGAGIKSLEDSRGQIRQKLLDGLADGDGNRRAIAMREKIDAAKLTTDDQWRGLADDVVTSNLTPYFAANEPIQGLGSDTDLLAEVGNAKEGFVGGPRRTQRGWIVYRVAKARTAGVTPFDETKEEARDFAKRARALDKLAKDMELRRGELIGAASLSAVAASFGGSAQTATDHKRETPINPVGSSLQFENAVFAASPNTLTPWVKIGERGVAVAKVTAVKTADMAAFAKEKSATRKTMADTELNRLLGSMLGELKRENPETINQEMVGRFRPKNRG